MFHTDCPAPGGQTSDKGGLSPASPAFPGASPGVVHGPGPLAVAGTVRGQSCDSLDKSPGLSFHMCKSKRLDFL